MHKAGILCYANGMTYSENYMTDAELRFEADLDAQGAEERFEESWYEDFEGEPDVYCNACGSFEHDDDECEEVFDDDDFQGGEDAWLDGSYEE